MQNQKESEDMKACELITLQTEFQTTEINPGNMMESGISVVKKVLNCGL
jgi:hypothetical protein